jgi:acetolactate synthase-1/2/3 large subunit
MKGTKALLDMLEKRGVDTIFGYPGGSVIPIYDELLDSPIRHVLVRHEQCAAHMADGYARAKNMPGVCLATSGPGTTNLVTGIATAYADSVPMIALTGQVAAGSLGLGAFQEVDAYSLLMPITKHSYRVLDVDRLPHAVSEAWDICRMGRKGPVHIDLPVDQMSSDIDESTIDAVYGVKPLSEDLSGINEAVKWIRESSRPVILVGGGAMDASEEVMKLARLLGAPVETTLMGVGAVPSSYEMNMGPLGLHGRMSALAATTNADLVISIGSRFSDRTYSAHDRMSGQKARVIHIDVDPTEFGKHGHPSVNLQGDAAKAVSRLICALGSDVPRISGWREEALAFKKRCCCRAEDDGKISPRSVMAELNRVIDKDTIVTTDVGQNQMWAMHYLKIERPRQFITSGTFGTMGFGLPSAIGAKAALPEKDVLTITGDGGLQMVIQELSTSVEEDIPVTVVLLNNGKLGMVRQMQKHYRGERYSGVDLGDKADFVAIAKGFGADGVRIDKAGELGDAVRAAKDSGRTTLIEVKIDPEADILPMLPADPRVPIVKGYCAFRRKLV